MQQTAMKVDSNEKRITENATPHTHSSEPCYLLKLAAKLRNEIWELAFTSDTNEDERQDLLNAAAPSSALLRTCRTIYEEAKVFHEAARARYWSTGRFSIESCESLCAADTLDKIRSLHERDVKLIAEVEVPVNNLKPGDMAGEEAQILSRVNCVWWETDRQGIFTAPPNVFVITEPREDWTCVGHHGEKIGFEGSSEVFEGHGYGMAYMSCGDQHEVADAREFLGRPRLTKFELLSAVVYCRNFTEHWACARKAAYLEMGQDE